MIKKSEKIVVTFYTATAAMAMEDICKSTATAGRIIPLPAFISADCGLGWCAETDSENQLKKLMEENGIVYQDIHRCMI